MAKYKYELEVELNAAGFSQAKTIHCDYLSDSDKYLKKDQTKITADRQMILDDYAPFLPAALKNTKNLERVDTVTGAKKDMGKFDQTISAVIT